MKRFAIPVALVFLSLLAMSHAQSRDAYFGVGTAYIIGAQIPVASLQVGSPVSDMLELRGTLDTIFVLNFIGADLLFTFSPSESLKLYLGAGPDVIFIPAAGAAFEFHGIAGLEYRTEEGDGLIGLYGELKPFFVSTVASGSPAVQLRAGINFHF